MLARRLSAGFVAQPDTALAKSCPSCSLASCTIPKGDTFFGAGSSILRRNRLKASPFRCVKLHFCSSGQTQPSTPLTEMSLCGYHFEVFGKVQGVFFRANTVEKAKELGLVGWCKNTDYGTVVGDVQGEAQACEQMKEWLSKVGSPQSKIERCVFSEEVADLKEPTFKSFDVVRKNYF